MPSTILPRLITTLPIRTSHSTSFVNSFTELYVSRRGSASVGVATEVQE